MTTQDISCATPDAGALNNGRKDAGEKDQAQTPVAEHQAQRGSAGDAEKIESPAARVRRVLVQPLLEDGLTRGKGVTVDAQAALQDKLCHRLGYLDESLLIVLRESVLRLAEGALRNQWPSFATIWNTAVRLQSPPDVELPIMTTWLTSVEGPRAQAGGYLVELRAWLRKNGRPPGSWEVAQIKASADDNRRRFVRLQEAAAVGRCSAEDLGWLEGYALARERCEALVAEGNARRAAAAAAAGAGA